MNHKVSIVLFYFLHVVVISINNYLCVCILEFGVFTWPFNKDWI